MVGTAGNSDANAVSGAEEVLLANVAEDRLGQIVHGLMVQPVQEVSLRVGYETRSSLQDSTRLFQVTQDFRPGLSSVAPTGLGLKWPHPACSNG